MVKFLNTYRSTALKSNLQFPANLINLLPNTLDLVLDIELLVDLKKIRSSDKHFEIVFCT